MKNREIKLIALDIDHTLKTQGLPFSDINREMIQKAQAQGIRVVPSTGRSYDGAQSVLLPLNLELDTLWVVNNGASIVDTNTDEVFYRQSIAPEKLQQILHTILELGYAYTTNTTATQYCSKEHLPEELAGAEHTPSGALYMYEKGNRSCIVFENVEELVEKTYGEIEKVNVFYDDIKDFYKIRERILQDFDVEVEDSYYAGAEITAKGVNKKAALEVLCSEFGIEREQVMAMGDSPNDRAMIEWAGIGVAVENADKEIKEVADYVAARVDQGGVGYAILEYALK